jgi:hypothetical protein
MKHEREPLPQRAAPFPDARERVARILTDGCAVLQETDTGHAAPSMETVRAVLERVTTTRLTQRQRDGRAPSMCWRFLRNARTRDAIGRVFLHRLQWHHGTGSANLYGSYFDAFDVGRVAFDTLDTIAAVFTQLFSRHGLAASHNETWRRALYGTGTARDAATFATQYRNGKE